MQPEAEPDGSPKAVQNRKWNLKKGKGAIQHMASATEILLETSLGDIRMELFEKEAPVTVENFLRYVDSGFYSGTIFHRVIPGFMIQGGGMDAAMNAKATGAPIRNEAGNGLSNTIGTVAMARTGVIDSATSQFFINVADNLFLDHMDNSPRGFGYAVFGRVTSGMEVVKNIVSAKTTSRYGHDDVSVEPIVILKVSRVAAE